MHILDAMQSAAVRLVGARPAGFFTSTEPFEQEIANLATDTAIAIMKAHDWRRLTTLATLTGDGVKAAFDLPPDYDRMVLGSKIYTGSDWSYEPAESTDGWLELQGGAPGASPGYWIILGGQIHFLPAFSEVARFYYISNYITAGRAEFSSDNDVFLLENRLLTLGLIWRWRAQKRMDYGEDLANYEVALEDNIARDKGGRVLVQKSRRRFGNVTEAYPGRLG